MIKLINNEFNKIKKSKIVFIQVLFIIVIYVIHRFTNRNLDDISFNLIQFVGVIICILFSGTISSEIENGQMRYYLTKPYKRYKIYIAKFFSILIYIIINNITIILCVTLINKNINYSYIIKYFEYSIPIVFIGALTLYLSTKFKNSVMVASMSIIILCFSLILAQLFFGYEINIVQYTFLPYLDFTIFSDKELISNMNKELSINLNISRGILINSISIMIMFILGMYKFNKKDIKS